MTSIVAVLLSLGLMALPLCASAASFDCATAASPREHAVCADPALSSADAQIATLYAAALAKLSPQGADLLRTSQRRWLAFVDDACLQKQLPVSDELRSWCISDAFRDRLSDLQSAVTTRGPFVFEQVDNYFLTYDVGNPDYLSFAKHQIINSRIDSPTNSTARIWNKKILVKGNGRSGCENGNGDTWNKVAVIFANQHAINTTHADSTYCHGTPHGYGGSEASTWILAPTVHRMVATDLFRRDGAWISFLRAAVLSDLHAEATKDGLTVKEAKEAEMLKTVENAVTDVGHWTFDKNVLINSFDLYELGLGRSFAPQVKISWTELSGLLVANPPVP